MYRAEGLYLSAHQARQGRETPRVRLH